MRVLFVSHQAEFLYGGEIVTLELMRALQAMGVDVHFASPEGPYAEKAAAVARVHKISSIQFSRRVHLLPRLLPALVKTKRELKEIIAREKITHVHATSLKAMVYCWRLRRRAPVLWHHHDIMPAGARNGLWARSLAKAASLILTPSNAAREALLEAGVDGKKVEVLYNGFVPSEWKTRPPREGGPLKAGMVGEISHRKGSDILYALMLELQRVSKAEPEVEFLIVGEGLSDKKFAERVRKDCEPFVKKGWLRFLGRRNDLKSLYQEMDVLLVPSRQDPLPTVVLEAMFSGLPVIGAPVGGIPEMVVPGETGFLESSPQHIVERLIAYRDDGGLWKKHAVNARKRADEMFSIEKSARKLQKLYSALSVPVKRS